MRALDQITAISFMNLRNLWQRFWSSLVVVVGVAGVVAVLVSVLAMASGFQSTVAGTGRADRAIILRGAANSELESGMSRSAAVTLSDGPGIKKDSDGRPIASAELLVMVNLPKKGQTDAANVALRGVGEAVFALRPEMQIVEGRAFQPSVYEAIVGKSAHAQFQGLEIGNRINIRGTEWTVVGVFTSNGDTHESEIMADAESIASAYRRPGFQAMSVMLESPEAFDALKAWVSSNPTLGLDVRREPDYYASQSRQLSQVLFFIAYFVGGIMAVGALFGALNTMYSAVAARTVEIATLRAIGFGSASVMVSVLLEALLLALAGGAVGALLAWLFFNGNAVSTLGANFTQLVFPLTVSGPVLTTGILWALAVGALGGLLPAARAARLPVAVALQVR